MSGRHDGANIANGFFNVLKDFNITSKVNALSIYSFFFVIMEAQNLEFWSEKTLGFSRYPRAIIIALHDIKYIDTFFLPTASCYHPRQCCK
jgi:hypothetical protein